MLGCALLRFNRRYADQVNMKARSRNVAILLAMVLGVALLLLLMWFVPPVLT